MVDKKVIIAGIAGFGVAMITQRFFCCNGKSWKKEGGCHFKKFEQKPQEQPKQA